MSNCLPEIITPHSRENNHKDGPALKKKLSTPPKLNFKGITLKEYFRICEEQDFNETINQMDEEENCSSSGSMVQTPTFAYDKKASNQRPKIKTEVNEEVENYYKNNVVRGNGVDLDSLNRNKISSIHVGHQNTYLMRENPFKKKDEKKKAPNKVHSNSSKIPIDPRNRSTLSSFYHCEENKKKMLNKVRAQKQRIHQLRLSEAFFITKYGSKFQIDPKQLIK